MVKTKIVLLTGDQATLFRLRRNTSYMAMFKKIQLELCTERLRPRMIQTHKKKKQSDFGFNLQTATLVA